MTKLVAPLFEGPLDIVGDIHGEWDVLRSLVGHLGYDAEGRHPGGRRLVFVGDLGDRGHDSPAVVAWVKRLVEAGRAQCVLGNHELNLIRRASKSGNRWYLEPDHPEQRATFRHSKTASAEQRAEWHEFFCALPLALERGDLRVVHAAWNTEAIAKLRALSEPSLAVFERYERELADFLSASGLEAAARVEKARYDLEDEQVPVPPLPNLAKLEEHKQMFNPVRVLTSGQERATQQPFYANQKWRVCDRVRWWEEYQEPVPVVVGHYWRNAGAEGEADVSSGKPNLFAGYGPNAWVGPRKNVFCVDFSIGGRYRERQAGARPFKTRLAAVRWPERVLVFDEGEAREMA